MSNLASVLFSDVEIVVVVVVVVVVVSVVLDKPEEFLLQLHKMDHFVERLECWLFKDKFTDSFDGIGTCTLWGFNFPGDPFISFHSFIHSFIHSSLTPWWDIRPKRSSSI